MPTTQTLLASITPSQSGTPIVLPYHGEKVKGCGYYGLDDVHTIQYAVEQFVGHVVIQGSLEVAPGEDDWFDVDSITGGGPLGLSLTDVVSFEGNFVWVRAVIESFTSGSINRIQLTYK